ncbi:hypothetical protein ACFLT2_04950 [Acidobacteriota bacterium]
MTSRNRMIMAWAVKCVLIFDMAFTAVAETSIRFEASIWSL